MEAVEHAAKCEAAQMETARRVQVGANTYQPGFAGTGGALAGADCPAPAVREIPEMVARLEGSIEVLEDAFTKLNQRLGRVCSLNLSPEKDANAPRPAFPTTSTLGSQLRDVNDALQFLAGRVYALEGQIQL